MSLVEGIDIANPSAEVEGPLVDAYQVLLGVFNSYDDITLSRIPSVINSISTLGYYEPRDGGAARYMRVATEPTHPGKVQSFDGAWWELDEKEPDPKMFGAICDLNYLVDVSMDAGTAIINSPSGEFTADDIGKRVLVADAGSNNGGLRALIADVLGPTQAVASINASFTVSNVQCFVASDCTEAVQHAWIYGEYYSRLVHLGPHIYYIAEMQDYLMGDNEYLLTTVGGTGFFGHYSGLSLIIYDDFRIGGVYDSCAFYGGTGTQGSEPANKITFYNIGIRGTFDFHGRSTLGDAGIVVGNLLRILRTNYIDVINCEFSYIRGAVSTPRGCKRARFIGNTIFYAARDGFFTHTTEWTEVLYNRIWFTDDDCIQVGTQQVMNPDTYLIEGGIVHGNLIVGCPSIKVSGCQGYILTDNKISFSIRSAFRIQDFGTGNRKGALTGCLVANNTILNPMRPEELGHSHLQDGPVISIICSGPTVGTGIYTEPALPGDIDPATGNFVDQYEYQLLNPMEPEIGGSPVDIQAVCPSFGIHIINNTMARTAKPVAAFSEYGVGHLSERGSFYWDPPVSEFALSPGGITLTGRRIHNLKVCNNTIAGLYNGFTFVPADITPDIVLYSNIFITDNTFYDLDIAGVHCIDKLRANNVDLVIARNIFDLDPQCRHPDRQADGSWLTYNSLPAISDLAFGSSQETGAIIDSNLFRNCSSPIDVSNINTGNVYTCLNNVVDAFIYGPAFRAENKGVSNLPRSSPGWRLRHAQYDRTQPFYGTILNDCPAFRLDPPATGTYMGGHHIQNINPVASGGLITTGWVLPGDFLGPLTGVDDWIPLVQPVFVGGSYFLTPNTVVTLPVQAATGILSLSCSDTNSRGFLAWDDAGVVSALVGISALEAHPEGTVLTGSSSAASRIGVSIVESTQTMYIENTFAANRLLIIRTLSF